MALPSSMIRAGIQCILGRDIFPAFGISLKVSNSSPNCRKNALVSLNSIAVDENSTVNGATSLPSAVQCLLDGNSALPESSRCNHPDSIIPLDTGNAVPVFRRQYRLPHALDSQVSA